MKQIKWCKLGDVCEIKNGYTPLKSKPEYWTNGSIPWVKIEDMRAQGADLHAAGNLVTPAAIKGKLLEPGTLLLSTTATIGVQSIVRTPCICNQQISAIQPKSSELDTKFLLYFISTQQHELLRLANHSGTVAILNNEGLRKLQIPIPPMDEQSRIVKILDTFEALLSNLNTELSLRIKQMRYYSEQLLSAENMSSFEWHKLGDVGEVKMCKRILKNQTTASGEVPFYKIGTFGKSADAFISRKLFEEYKAKYSYPKKGEILLSASGTIGRTVIFDGEDAYFQDSNIVWLAHDESVILNKYLYWCYQVVDFAPTAGGTISRLYNDDLRKIKIPIPPMDEQARIAKILDTFEALLDNIRTEINQRSKQARFYKEQLLNFEQS